MPLVMSADVHGIVHQCQLLRGHLTGPMQACCGLEESGVVDGNTWKELLGPEMLPSAPPADVQPTKLQF